MKMNERASRFPDCMVSGIEITCVGAVITTVGFTAEDASGPSNGVSPEALYELPADMERFAESCE